MLYRFLAFASLALLALPAISRADEDDSGNVARNAGPLEMTFAGAGSSDKSFKDSDITASTGLAWYLAPWFDVGVRDSVTYESRGTYSFDNVVRGAVDFNIPIDRFEPFVGGNVGYGAGHGALEGSSGQGGPEAGLKYFITDRAFIYTQIEYDFFFNGRTTSSASSALNSVTHGQFAYFFGFGIRL